MGFQVGALVEGPTAHWALVGGFFHVEDLVDRKGAGLAEALSAFHALEGFLFAVDVPESKHKIMLDSIFQLLILVLFYGYSDRVVGK